MKVKPTFDEYINGSERFAQPILHFLRECIHEVHPSINEEIKWNFPCFIYNGSILANMAGFKQHATFGFWLSLEMKDEYDVFVHGEKTGMGNFGKITSLENLPSKEVLKSYIREAMDLHDMGVKTSPSKDKSPVPNNQHLLQALKKQSNVQEKFDRLSPSAKVDYHDWINTAKTETTRDRRLSQAIGWISDGKPRNWKYMKSWKGKS